ncbi:MAG: hypothetical protein ABIC04_02195 [Nanoarchaeota archaeon]
MKRLPFGSIFVALIIVIGVVVLATSPDTPHDKEVVAFFQNHPCLKKYVNSEATRVDLIAVYNDAENMDFSINLANEIGSDGIRQVFLYGNQGYGFNFSDLALKFIREFEKKPDEMKKLATGMVQYLIERNLSYMTEGMLWFANGYSLSSSARIENVGKEYLVFNSIPGSAKVLVGAVPFDQNKVRLLNVQYYMGYGTGNPNDPNFYSTALWRVWQKTDFPEWGKGGEIFTRWVIDHKVRPVYNQLMDPTYYFNPKEVAKKLCAYYDQIGNSIYGWVEKGGFTKDGGKSMTDKDMKSLKEFVLQLPNLTVEELTS